MNYSISWCYCRYTLNILRCLYIICDFYILFLHFYQSEKLNVNKFVKSHVYMLNVHTNNEYNNKSINNLYNCKSFNTFPNGNLEALFLSFSSLFFSIRVSVRIVVKRISRKTTYFDPTTRLITKNSSTPNHEKSHRAISSNGLPNHRVVKVAIVSASNLAPRGPIIGPKIYYLVDLCLY